MDDDTHKKLSDNVSRVTAISALRHIRKLVDGYEEQDRKNKRKAIILIIVMLIFAVSITYFVIRDNAVTITLNNDANQTSP